MSSIYVDAMEELIHPFPSFKLLGQDQFNNLVGGFRTREFTILCGSTGTGKTTLLANWAKSFIESGIRVFVMSVETGPTDFIKRTMSVFLGKDINKGECVPIDQLQSFDNQYGDNFRSDNLFLSLYDSRVSHKRVIDEIKYHYETKKCQIVFIDNINFLMEVTKSADTIIEMDRVVHDMIMLCKQIDIHIVMVMHPKKTMSGRVENEFDIKGSSTAVQEAHNIFLFNRPSEKDDKYGFYHRELTIQKLRRRGENVGKRIVYRSHGTRYVEEIII